MEPAPSTKAETPIRRYFFIACRRLPCGRNRFDTGPYERFLGRSARFVQPMPRIDRDTLVSDLKIEFPRGLSTVCPIIGRLSPIGHKTDSLSRRDRLTDRDGGPVEASKHQMVSTGQS